MALHDDLERIAAVAARLGTVEGVLAAEPAGGRRVYLVALGGDERRWVLLDSDGSPLDRREDVRAAASIVAMCELAADVAGGGDLKSLRGRLAELRTVEQAPRIDELEQAALAVEHAVGAAPRVASPAYLDELGAATFALERALGDTSSPFATALGAGTAAVDAFVRDVECGHALPLR